jgi:hypothetical protein
MNELMFVFVKLINNFGTKINKIRFKTTEAFALKRQPLFL